MRILNVRVDEIDMNAALAEISAAVATKEQARFFHVVTLNAEGIYMAQHDAEFLTVIENAGLVTPDGNGVLWAARQMNVNLPERVTGIDLIHALCAKGAKKSWRIYLLGGKPGIAEEASKALQGTYPGIEICGVHDGYFHSQAEDEEQVITDIAAQKPDILLVGMGMPFQEKWLAANAGRLNVAVAIGVGGSFDVIAGRIKRAPKLWQKLKLEWLWRVFLEPKRIKRIMVLPLFMWKVVTSRRSSVASR